MPPRPLVVDSGEQNDPVSGKGGIEHRLRRLPGPDEVFGGRKEADGEKESDEATHGDEFEGVTQNTMLPLAVCQFNFILNEQTSLMPAADRYRVPILDRSLDLLELLADHPDGLTLTAMTDRLKMPKNSVFRIATTLTLRGYATREEVSKLYRLSPKLLSLSQRGCGGERIAVEAGPILTALRDASRETALLGTLSGGQGVVLDQVPSPQPVKVVVEIGHSFPLHTAAPAKAILAFLPREECEARIALLTFPRFTRHTLISATAFRRELEEVRKLGIAVDRGEESETFVCVAAPVFDRHRHPVAALWLSGPADRMGAEKRPALGAIVKHYAAELSKRLGCPD